ncbi:MAG: folylpolyglutamate synthase/dihydrofolate synthase family protein [Lachnospiraceae bacterium]|nr:bifunctional folylpolyglutamate synthase/dihydrofolate synthase [Robinsoniella sp.]MDY3766554.1 folylpolyglutamate synthase/dihydrofolate synthase family protein [Lachnospiraceae bacterium]
MDYQEARVYLENVTKYGSVLGLENMKELLDRLSNPQDELKFIHIAGTNGKGSVLAYVSTVLAEAGYRVGRYISPTLFSYRERIQVNGEYIEREALARWVTQIKTVIDQMTGEGKAHPTVFEIETALSFLYFKEKKCDFVVLETGMGGTLDATNVVKTTVAEIIVSISLDHLGVLGNNLREIAQNKAGIIKPETVVITAKQEQEAMEVLEDTCREKKCRLYVADDREVKEIHYGYERQSFDYKQYKNLEISLAGSYQITNAVIAVEALDQIRELGYSIPEKALREGLKKTTWKGRFTILRKKPIFVIDGAHNRDAARVLRQSIDLYFADKKIFYIMGMFKDKEYEEVLRQTADRAEHIFTIETPDNVRALPAEALAEAARKYNEKVEPAGTIEEAVERTLAMTGKDDVVIAFGSLSFLGQLTKAVEGGKE